MARTAELSEKILEYVEFSIVFTEDDSGLKVAFQITFRGLAA